jgi:Putative restriction endonuclease
MADNAARLTTPMTIEGFLSFLDRQPDHETWELHDGAPVMMVRGTAAHALIAGNIDRALFPLARDKDCQTFRGFLVRASDTSMFEPDVVIHCGTSIHKADTQPMQSSSSRSCHLRPCGMIEG